MRRVFAVLALLMTALPVMTAAAQACDSGTNLRAGLSVQVRTGVNVRASAGLDARSIGGLSVGERLTLVGGPVCASTLTWWQVSGDEAGWVAESSQNITYLEAAPVIPGELLSPIDGVTVRFVTPASIMRDEDLCPAPDAADISVNFAAVADPFASGSEAAFFVDGGFGVPLPALCIPASRASEATVSAPDGALMAAPVLPVEDVPDFVRATLPETALLMPGTWRIAVGDFTLDVRVSGPFAPFVDAKTGDTGMQVVLAGFAPSERVALLMADVEGDAASNVRALTLVTDSHGMAGADLEGVAASVLVAAISESGLIALPSAIQSLDMAGVENRAAVYDALAIALWGHGALGFGEPTAEPTPEATFTPTPPTATPESTQALPTAAPTGIVNLQPSATPAAIVGVPDEGCVYIVKSGDTFFKIALANGLTTPQLREANPQITNTWLIYTGDILNIPGCGQGMP